MNSMHLHGSEEVASAGRSMRAAAEEMRSAASTMDSAARDMARALQDHQQFLSGFLEAFGAIVDRMPPPQQITTQLVLPGDLSKVDIPGGGTIYTHTRSSIPENDG